MNNEHSGQGPSRPHATASARHAPAIGPGTAEHAEWLRESFEWAPIGLAHVGLSGHFLYVNRRLCALLGRDAEALAALRFQDITHPADLAFDLDHVVKLLAGQIDSYTIEKRYLRADGSVVPARLSVSLVRSDSGSAMHFVSVVEPLWSDASEPRSREAVITDAATPERRTRVSDERSSEADRERLRASEEFNRRILESSPDCIKVLSLDARIEFFSVGGMCAMEVDDFECQLRGTDWFSFWSCEDRPMVRAAVDTALAGGIGRFQAFCPTAKGTPKWWDVSVSAIDGSNGAPEKLMSISRDVTEQKRVEQQLRESAARLQLATEAAAVGTWDCDLPGKALRWDARTKSLFGLPPDATVTWDMFLAALHAADRPRVEAAVDAALAPEGLGRFDVEYRAVGLGDGVERWIAARGKALFADGKPVRFIGTSVEITERKRAERALAASEARYRTFVEAAPQLGWSCHPDGTIAQVNGRWLQYTGQSLAEATGGAWMQAVHPADREQASLATAQGLTTGAGFGYEFRLRRHDGIYRWFSVRVEPLRETSEGDRRQGAIAGWYGAAVDVDDGRGALEAARAAQAALAAADARKDEFLAMLAHELRNPLTPVLNAARLLGRSELLTENGQRAVEMIERQTRHMKRLVDDLLEISRITRGTIELRPEKMLVGAAIQNVVESVLPAFDAKRQRLQAVLPHEPVRLVADAVRIAQILENLLTNASKYTPEGGKVRIEASDDDTSVTIRVVDDGIGIEPDKLEDVFGLFVQAEPSVGEHQGGLGIGLAMVRRLVGMHGGTVRAESAGRGLGSTFTVRLPKSGPRLDG